MSLGKPGPVCADTIYLQEKSLAHLVWPLYPEPMSLWTPPGADLGDLAGPTQDPITQYFYAGLDEHGRPRKMTYRNLVRRTEEWPVTAATPEGPANLLKTARDMFALGLYSYNLVASSCSWSLFAVEAALKLRLNKPKASFQRLIAQAATDGLLSAHAAGVLEAGRTIRNDFVHEGKQPVWTFAMSVDIIRVSHVFVAELYPDAAV